MLGSKEQIDLFVSVLTVIVASILFFRSLPLSLPRILTNIWFVGAFFWIYSSWFRFSVVFLGQDPSQPASAMDIFRFFFFMLWVFVSVVFDLVYKPTPPKTPPSQPSTSSKGI